MSGLHDSFFATETLPDSLSFGLDESKPLLPFLEESMFPAHIKITKPIRQALHLVSRALRALAGVRFMQVILFGNRSTVEPTSDVPFQHTIIHDDPYDVSLIDPRHIQLVIDKLGELPDLLEFRIHRRDDRGAETKPLTATTKSPFCGSIIYLPGVLIDDLIALESKREVGSPDEVAEMSLGHLLAHLLGHEIGHALWISTRIDPSAPEPFLKDEIAAEICYSMEKAIFGGCLHHYRRKGVFFRGGEVLEHHDVPIYGDWPSNWRILQYRQKKDPMSLRGIVTDTTDQVIRPSFTHIQNLFTESFWANGLQNGKVRVPSLTTGVGEVRRTKPGGGICLVIEQTTKGLRKTKPIPGHLLTVMGNPRFNRDEIDSSSDE